MKFIEDLLWEPGLPNDAQPLEMDPLSEVDALQEAQLLDTRIHAISSTAGLLIELRTALQLRQSNTAVLVARGLLEYTWSAEPTTSGNTAWNIIGSEPSLVNELLVLELTFFPHANLRLKAECVEFYAGNVASLGASPPDYTQEDGHAIQSGLARWRSIFQPTQIASHGNLKK